MFLFPRKGLKIFSNSNDQPTGSKHMAWRRYRLVERRPGQSVVDLIHAIRLYLIRITRNLTILLSFSFFDSSRTTCHISHEWRISLYRSVSARQFDVVRGHPRPVLASGYCHCLRLSVCLSVCLCVRQPRVCPCLKSSSVQARTTKFWQKVQNNLIKVPIV